VDNTYEIVCTKCGYTAVSDCFIHIPDAEKAIKRLFEETPGLPGMIEEAAKNGTLRVGGRKWRGGF